MTSAQARWCRDALPSCSRRMVLRRAALAGGIAVAGFQGACGSHQTVSKTTGAASNRSGLPQSGGQLNLVSKQDLSTLDPATLTLSVALVLALTNDSLIRFRLGPDVQYNDLVLEPSLAGQWETPDAQTNTFHLRPGVKFADVPPVNGRAMTSADVKWSFEYLSRTGELANAKLGPSNASSLFAGLQAIETPDAATAVVRFNQPFAPFLTYAASEYSSVLAHEIFDQDGDLSKRAVGTGPAQMDLQDSQHGARWVHKKNPSYFMPGRPYLDQINELVLPDDATSYAAFRAKQIDILGYSAVSLDTASQIKKALPNVVLYEFPDTRGGHIYMNVAKPPLDDVRVRQAIALAMDRDEFIQALSNGQGEWALAASLPGLFSPEETKQILHHDPAQAKQLLTAAGYANGVDIDFTYPPKKYGAEYITRLQLLQAQLKKAGINLVLKAVDDATYIEWIRRGDYGLSMVSRAGSSVSPDLDSTLYPVFHSRSPLNNGRVNDPDLDKLLEAQRREPDQTKRKEIMRQAVRRINEVPWALGFYFGHSYELWHPYVKNYAPNLGTTYTAETYHITDIWLDK